jgi:hypothetical protein
MKSMRTILALCMPVVYALAGAMLLFTSVLGDTIVRFRPALGGLLLGYGMLRAFLWWNKHRKAIEEQP